jgi:hypothetical protein
MDGWSIIQRARETGCSVISKEELVAMATDPATCLEPVVLYFSDKGLGRLRTNARDAIDQLRWKVFRCEVIPDDDVPPNVPIEMRTSWREAERKRLREDQEKSWQEAHARAAAARGRGLQLIRDSLERGYVVAREEIEVIAADPDTCMSELLIICGSVRVRTAARDCARIVHLIEASGEEYVRYVSVTSRTLAALGLPTVADPDCERCAS